MDEKKKQPNRTKVPVGMRLDPEVLERLRNAVFWIGQGKTVNGVIEEAAVAALEQLEKEHNGGKPFRERTGSVPRGNA